MNLKQININASFIGERLRLEYLFSKWELRGSTQLILPTK